MSAVADCFFESSIIHRWTVFLSLFHTQMQKHCDIAVLPNTCTIVYTHSFICDYIMC